MFKGIVLRMGAFHTICTLLYIIGKRFQDAGLRDICIESRVIAERSVSAVLGGRRYNRAVRFHKLMYGTCLERIGVLFTIILTMLATCRRMFLRCFTWKKNIRKLLNILNLEGF